MSLCKLSLSNLNLEQSSFWPLVCSSCGRVLKIEKGLSDPSFQFELFFFRRAGEKSAYSVFNPGCEAIHGTLKSEDLMPAAK